MGGCFGVRRSHERRSLEKEQWGFSLGSLWLKPLIRSGKQRTIFGCATFTLIWRNSHWSTNIEKSMIWLVWNVASLIPSANSIKLFCRRDKFHLPIESRKLYHCIVKVARDRQETEKQLLRPLVLVKVTAKSQCTVAVSCTLLFPLNDRESKPIPAPLFWLPFLVAADWAVGPLPLLLASGFLYL